MEELRPVLSDLDRIGRELDGARSPEERSRLAAELDALIAVLRQHQEALERQREALERQRSENLIHDEVCYEDRRNPLFAWGGILSAGEEHELPAWVRAYLSQVASALMALASDRGLTPKAALRKVPVALGLSRPGWSAFEDIRSFEDAAPVAFEVLVTPGKRESVADEVGRKSGRSARTVFRWVDEFKKQLSRERALTRNRGPK
jgi:hypothetical protein